MHPPSVFNEAVLIPKAIIDSVPREKQPSKQMALWQSADNRQIEKMLHQWDRLFHRDDTM